jgi:hypothetical protein
VKFSITSLAAPEQPTPSTWFSKIFKFIFETYQALRFSARLVLRVMPAMTLVCLCAVGALIMYANLSNLKLKLSFDINDFNNLAAVTAFLMWSFSSAINLRSTASTVLPRAQIAASHASEFLTHAGFRWLIAWTLMFIYRTFTNMGFGPNPTGWIWATQQLTFWAKVCAIFVLVDAFLLTLQGVLHLEHSYAINKDEEGRSSQPSS